MADFSKGWITLLRSIQDHELWQRKPFGKGQAWIDLILSANHKENKIMLGNTIHEIQRGEFITSQRKLAEKWGWSRNTVKTFLNLLRSRAMIELKTTHELSHLTITNYNHLQKTSTTNRATKEPPLEPPKSHHLSTIKECNNENNIDMSATKAAQTYFYSSYKKTFQKEYVAAFGKDGAIFKGLTAIIPIEELKTLIDKFFTSEDDFIKKSDYGVGVFRSVINKLQKPTKQPEFIKP